MIKSTRVNKGENHVFLDLLCMDKIEKILAIFTLKPSSKDKGGVIHILSLSLASIQTVRYINRSFSIKDLHLHVSAPAGGPQLLLHLQVLSFTLTVRGCDRW
jgi:hypothetical protein